MNSNDSIRTLANVPVGTTAIIHKLFLNGATRTRLLDLGMIEGTEVTCLGCGPSGDPTAYLIRGAVVALRHADSSRIEVQSWD